MFEHHRGGLTGDSTTSECFWSLYHPITIKLGRGKGSLVSCQSPQVANDSKAWAPVSRTCRWRSRAWVWPILALPCWWAPVMAVFPSSAWAPSWPSWSHQWFSQCPQKSLKCHEMSRSTIAVELNMYSRPCFWNLLERYAGTGSPIYRWSSDCVASFLLEGASDRLNLMDTSLIALSACPRHFEMWRGKVWRFVCVAYLVKSLKYP